MFSCKCFFFLTIGHSNFKLNIMKNVLSNILCDLEKSGYLRWCAIDFCSVYFIVLYLLYFKYIHMYVGLFAFCAVLSLFIPGSRGVTWGLDPLPQNETRLESLENHKATKPVFNVGSLLAYQRNAF